MEQTVIKTMAECIKEGQIDRARVEATTEAEIRQHMIEDGEDPDDQETGYGPWCLVLPLSHHPFLKQTTTLL